MTVPAPEWNISAEFPPVTDVSELRIRFGQRPNQTMPVAWAEDFLEIVYNEYPGVFRAILPRLYGLPDEPKRGRKAQ